MHVYRFHDLVAVNPPGSDGKTFYLLPSEATNLAIAMLEASGSVNREPFQHSTMGTIEIDATGSRYRGDGS